MTNHHLSFREIVNIDELKKLFEAFSTATGFTTGLVDKTANEILIGTGWRDICVKFHRANSASVEHCKASGRELTAGLNTPGEIRICHCQSGLVDGCTPIVIEGRHIANLATGQVLFAPPEIDRFKEQARQYGYDEQAYLDALSEVPVVNEETFKAMLLFLARLATTVAKIGLANLQSQRDNNEIANNKALLDSMVNSIPDLISYKDQEDKYLGCNKAFEEYAGYEEKDIVGRTDFDFFPKEVAEFFLDKDREMFASGKAKRNEEWITYPEGREVLVDTLKTPYIGPDGNVLGLIGVSRDITQLKEAEQKLKVIFETASDGILVFDIENKEILTANIAGCRMLGYSIEEILNIGIMDIHPEKDLPYVLEQFEKQLKQEIVVASDIPVKRKDGTIFYADISSGPMLLKGKQYMIGLFRDITERKKAEEERVKLESQLQQAHKMEAIGTLAGGIAHDFNNILGAILGYAEMAQEEAPKGSVLRSDLDQILLAGHRAKELVAQILAFSRLTKSEQVSLLPQPILKEAIKLLRSSIPTTTTIKLNIEEKCGMIKADPTQLHQVIMNLCTNAYQAMEEDGGILSIGLERTVLTEDDIRDEPSLSPGLYVQLTVDDTGSGIDPASLEHIFEPYFTTKEAGKGTGMGLAVIHGIVKNHGGMIRVNSKMGEGTTFHVFFPEILATSEKKATVTNQSVPTGNERILFVDDEQILADLGKQLLGRLGYTVTASTSSIEAIEMFRKQPNQFDLVITDQTMPEMTGADLAQEILAIRPNIPIILCTGYSSILSKEKALALGIRAYVMKPMAKKDIAPLIRKVLSSEKIPS
ncbi:MAG: PAS domain S-box protein [Desulfobulbaceae bacterium]|nr:PAS domain S-box protein [Desulfobulbaceae bacterium]